MTTPRSCKLPKPQQTSDVSTVKRPAHLVCLPSVNQGGVTAAWASTQPVSEAVYLLPFMLSSTLVKHVDVIRERSGCG